MWEKSTWIIFDTILTLGMWDILRSVWSRHVTTPTQCTEKEKEKEKEKDFFMYVGDAAGQ